MVVTTNGPTKILCRSIRHLIPIEVSETNEAASIDLKSSREGYHDNSNDEHNDHEDCSVSIVSYNVLLVISYIYIIYIW